MEHSEADRGFRFKSVWERLLPFRKFECSNCTRVAEPGGWLCEACTINARHDPSIGKYPTVTAVLLVSAAAVLIAVPFAFAGDDTSDSPPTAAAAPIAEFPEPDVISEPEYSAPEYSAPETRSARSDGVIETAASEVAFIATLRANDVEFSTKDNAIGIGRTICAVVDDATDVGRSEESGMDQAEDIMTGEGFSDNDAAAYVGAAMGALC